MKNNKLASFFLFFISIAFLALSQPSFLNVDGLSFFAWIAYIPLFLLVERLPLRKAVWIGALLGFILYSLLCSYLISFGLIALLFVSFLFAFYYSFLFFLISFAEKLFAWKQIRFFWLFRVLIILSLEFLRTKGLFAFSYGIIGYSMWKEPFMLKFSSFSGIWGVSAVILLFNSICAKIISERNLRENLNGLSLTLSLISGIYLYWLFTLLLPFHKQVKEGIPVALIQNASSASSRNISDYERDAGLLKKLSLEALSSQPETELVVWPETSVVPDIIFHLKEKSDKRRYEISKGLFDFFGRSQSSFLIGANSSIIQSGKRQACNSALYFSGDEKQPAVYNKNHLVPFTEYWPSFLDYKVFDGIKNSLGCDLFVPGKEIKVFTCGKACFGVPICFEDSFPGIIRTMKKEGADFLINITDDAWAESRAEKNMHLAMSVFRAAEFKSPVIRSSIDGITCFIDSDGKIISSLTPGSDGYLCGKVLLNKAVSVYYLTGDWPLTLTSVFVFTFMLILSSGFVKVKVYGRRETEKESDCFGSANRI